MQGPGFGPQSYLSPLKIILIVLDVVFFFLTGVASAFPFELLLHMAHCDNSSRNIWGGLASGKWEKRSCSFPSFKGSAEGKTPPNSSTLLSHAHLGTCGWKKDAGGAREVGSLHLRLSSRDTVFPGLGRAKKRRSRIFWRILQPSCVDSLYLSASLRSWHSVVSE